MTVFDLDKHLPIAFLPLAGGPDVIKFDPGLGRIYVACYSGAVSVFHQDDPEHYRKLESARGCWAESGCRGFPASRTKR